MLNGKYPVLIFHVYNYQAIANKLLGFVNVPPPKLPISPIGIPIPFILSEQLTGIAIDSETKSIDVSTTIDAPLDPSEPAQVKQQPMSSSINVSLAANRDSIFLTVLSALGDLVLRKTTAGDYGITYMSGPIAIFNGLLSRFSTMAGANDTLMRIDFSISTASEDTSPPDKKKAVTPLEKISGSEAGPTLGS